MVANSRWRRIGWVAGGALVLLGVGFAAWTLRGDDPRARGLAQAATVGKAVYAAQCAACHGANLEGQPNWRERLPNGRLPAPPHDATGHTWHHDDAMLFGITKQGPAPYAPAGYQSDMPPFADTLSDEQIWAVLGYIKSTWPREIQDRQAAISAQSGSRR